MTYTFRPILAWVPEPANEMSTSPLHKYPPSLCVVAMVRIIIYWSLPLFTETAIMTGGGFRPRCTPLVWPSWKTYGPKVLLLLGR